MPEHDASTTSTTAVARWIPNDRATCRRDHLHATSTYATVGTTASNANVDVFTNPRESPKDGRIARDGARRSPMNGNNTVKAVPMGAKNQRGESNGSTDDAFKGGDGPMCMSKASIRSTFVDVALAVQRSGGAGSALTAIGGYRCGKQPIQCGVSGRTIWRSRGGA